MSKEFDSQQQEETKRINQIKAKVVSMGRISLMLKNAKQSKEDALKAIKAANKTTIDEDKIEPEQVEKIFNGIVRRDSMNEAFPIASTKRKSTITGLPLEKKDENL